MAFFYRDFGITTRNINIKLSNPINQSYTN